MVILKTTKDG